MTLVKDCKDRQKNGRCKSKGHYCCFLLKTAVVCKSDKPKTEPKKRRKKR